MFIWLIKSLSRINQGLLCLVYNFRYNRYKTILAVFHLFFLSSWRSPFGQSRLIMTANGSNKSETLRFQYAMSRFGWLNKLNTRTERWFQLVYPILAPLPVCGMLSILPSFFCCMKPLSQTVGGEVYNLSGSKSVNAVSNALLLRSSSTRGVSVWKNSVSSI